MTPCKNHGTVVRLSSGPGLSCNQCRHFMNDPDVLEDELKGLTILSSAYGSTRANAGICRKLNLFLEPVRAYECGDFEQR
jgi:hypothetical protein